VRRYRRAPGRASAPPRGGLPCAPLARRSAAPFAALDLLFSRSDPPGVSYVPAAFQVSVQATQRTLAEHAPDPDAYAAKYAELKAKNVRELDRFLMVAAKVLTGARPESALL